MIETTAALRSAKMKAPVCIGVHAVFAPGAYDALREGAARVVTTNTIAHESNTIDVSGMLADAIADL
jgi:ribose-phosphate pyrophosphokinase